MDWESPEEEDLGSALNGEGVFILCEGNFQYGNASLSYYNPEKQSVENEVFIRANGMRLGDTAQSVTIRDGLAWIVVNNSHVVFAIDIRTGREAGRITGMTSPRHIHFVSDTKAYVSQLWDNRIFIVNPQTFSITGWIVCPDMEAESGSTEQMVQDGRFVYVCCWSYQRRILRIDTETDEVTGSIEAGIQPVSLVKDCNGRLWTLTDGGHKGSPDGCETPALHRISTEPFAVEKTFTFQPGSAPSELQLNAAGDTLFWIDGGILRMPVTAEEIPESPFISARGTKYYGLTVSPLNGDVYVADAIDYQQAGMVYRYTARGLLKDSFLVGVIPGAFCWKP